MTITNSTTAQTILRTARAARIAKTVRIARTAGKTARKTARKTTRKIINRFSAIGTPKGVPIYISEKKLYTTEIEYKKRK